MRFSPYGPATVTGAPYSGDEVEDVNQTLSDGTHIARHTLLERKYRDSMGRTREERPLDLRAGSDRSDAPMLVHIFDPVAHVQYILDPAQQIVHRADLADRNAPCTSSSTQSVGTQAGILRSAPAQSAATANSVEASVATSGREWWVGTGGTAPPSPAQRSAVAVPIQAPATTSRSAPDDARRPKTSSEDLGTDTIEGLLVSGRRTTHTYPTGSQGNDRPFTVTHEYWRSSELNLEVLSKNDDPRNGERIRKVTNISRSEPDPSLFQPPPGYTIKDETGEFTITFSIPQP
jgi:hypothetical protein